jgi:two-component SAPR family response regulator
MLGQEPDDDAIRLAEKAVSLYRGDFLDRDRDMPWTVRLRERLRDRFIRINLKMGLSLEQKGEYRRAIDCYQRGLDVDDLQEELYQRIMRCFH